MNLYSKSIEYGCRADLNIYDSPELTRLATQAKIGRHLQILSSIQDTSIEVRLCEDDYPGWLLKEDACWLSEAVMPYSAISFPYTQIRNRLPYAIAFAHSAMKQPNYYLWGGTVGPNYDCSGLMQAAFASVGIWLPRDSYQQEAFTETMEIDRLLAGDLVFFGSQEKTTHVGLYLGEGYYIHSSGENGGRNGIGIDLLSEQGDAVSQFYYRQFRVGGRVVKSYQPRSHS